MLCDLVISLGKIPVLWADIALKYPEAIKTLPKGTVFVDWNYGWDLNYFGEHSKLLQSGYEMWGAASLRSNPDNYNLTCWKKHFNNIRDFIPASRTSGYTGMIMTSWSTSGAYSSVFESSSDLVDLYAIRHVYPLSGFNMLIGAYATALEASAPLNIRAFIKNYCEREYGFAEQESFEFWQALTASPFKISQGKVDSPHPLTITQVADSNQRAIKILTALNPKKNNTEFEHYTLMADIRQQYLDFELLQQQINEKDFTTSMKPQVLKALENLIARAVRLNQRFIELNKEMLYPQALAEENRLRVTRIKLLYDRLSSRK